jgi:arsenate reductase
MGVKVYEYSGCSTCKRALKYLDGKKIKYTKMAIVDQPPKISELKEMLKHLKKKGLTIKNLFNTSGQVYRELNMAEKLKENPPEEELLQLLSKNGKLIKRPFVLTGDDGVVGFKEEEWKKLF